MKVTAIVLLLGLAFLTACTGPAPAPPPRAPKTRAPASAPPAFRSAVSGGFRKKGQDCVRQCRTLFQSLKGPRARLPADACCHCFKICPK
ncbi:MAG TPA: hypothetical protein DDZ83_11225 [Nitrospinae bacterium]|nr:hypothetical protein [Nitrospinota bacterium]